MRLTVKKLTFSAAHWLPGHAECGYIHGHTYYIRNLVVETDKFVDFEMIARIIKLILDHKLFVPSCEEKNFERMLKQIRDNPIVNIFNNFKVIPKVSSFPETSVENLSVFVKMVIEDNTSAKVVHFELYEGPGQGVEYVQRQS